MSDALSFDLLRIVKTTDDKDQLLTILEKVSSSFFSQERDLINVLEKNFPYGKKEILLQIAQKNTLSLEDGKLFIEKITNAIMQMTEVSLTLSFAPTQEVVNAISAWFVLSIKQAVLLDIIVDKTLIGGAIIGYKGKHTDFSLRKKLKERYGNGEMRLMISKVEG